MRVIEYSKTMKLDTASYKIISFIPFDPSSKKTESKVEYNNKQFRVVKGAPQIIISLCNFSDEKQKLDINDKLAELSEKGFRVLAVAISEE